MKCFLKEISIFFITILICSTSLAQELMLPQPSGDYSIGTKALQISDPSRKMFRGQEQTHFMIQAFYPSQKHEGLYPYMPGTLINGRLQGNTVFTHAMPNAKPLKNKKFSLILFIPGLGATRQQYTILCEELASQGYIVFSIDQPFVSSYVKFLDHTTIVLTLKDAWKVPRDRNYRYQYFDRAVEEVIKNIIYIIENLEDISICELGDIIDKNNIIIMGHSFGGNVAHILGFKEEKIKAIVDIDSKITERKIFGHLGVPPNPIGKPVLFIRGMMQYQEDVGDQLTKFKEATIWSPQVSHSAFSDNAYFANKIKKFGYNGFISQSLNWLFKRGPHFSNIDTNLNGKEVSIWFKEYVRYIVNWLNKIRAQKIEGYLSQFSPIGDNINTEVYSFIKDILLKEKILDATELNNFIEEQKKIFKNLEESKPHFATISENELAHILKSLCQTNKNCQEITLYQKNGVGIATTGLKENITLNKESNNYIKMGTLGYDPVKMIGINKFISQDKIVYYEIIKAIYYDKKNDNAHLSLQLPLENHTLIGYVRYIITIN